MNRAISRGLVAPAQQWKAVAGITNLGSSTTLPLNISTAGGGIFDIVPTATFTICNTSSYVVGGRVTAMSGGIFCDAAPGMLAIAYLEISRDGGAYSASPVTDIWMDNGMATTRRYGISNQEDDYFRGYVLNPGACFTVDLRVRVSVSAGTGVINGTMAFEVQWDLFRG